MAHDYIAYKATLHKGGRACIHSTWRLLVGHCTVPLLLSTNREDGQEGFYFQSGENESRCLLTTYTEVGRVYHLGVVGCAAGANGGVQRR